MKKISSKTISRALLYIRTLESLIKEKRSMVSSAELAGMTGLTDVQIRKDISQFGKVGVPRLGYDTRQLKNVLEDFVLQEDVIHIALFGAGNLGTAIMKYPGFSQQKIKIVAAFDKDPRKIGRVINGVKVYPSSKAPSVIKRKHADIGIVAVPPEYAQEVADIMALSGLKGIVNFAPVFLNVPDGVSVKDIDLTIEFLSLFCGANVSRK